MVAISMAVAVGHGKSSMLPFIVLITSLGAASPHTHWPLPLLWNSALLTQCCWCHWAQGCMMGGEERFQTIDQIVLYTMYKHRQQTHIITVLKMLSV